MRTQYTPKIILSTDRHDVEQGVNSANFIQFLEVLEKVGVPYLRTRGSYDGYEERGFILEDNKRNREIAFGAMEFYNQDCILIMDNEGTGTLHFQEGGLKKIGKLKVLTEKPQGDYTKVLDSSEYFTFE